MQQARLLTVLYSKRVDVEKFAKIEEVFVRVTDISDSYSHITDTRYDIVAGYQFLYRVAPIIRLQLSAVQHFAGCVGII